MARLPGGRLRLTWWRDLSVNPNLRRSHPTLPGFIGRSVLQIDRHRPAPQHPFHKRPQVVGKLFQFLVGEIPILVATANANFRWIFATAQIEMLTLSGNGPGGPAPGNSIPTPGAYKTAAHLSAVRPERSERSFLFRSDRF